MNDVNMQDLMKRSFEELEKDIFSFVCSLAKEMTVYCLEQLDKYLMLNRDSKQYKTHSIRKTTIKTVYGEVEYKRRLYYDTHKKEYIHLLDENMQMDKLGTISTNLTKKIAQAVVNMPYRKAAKLISETTGQSISSVGIWGIAQQIGNFIQEDEVQKLRAMDQEQSSGTHESKVIFQEADGVWLNIQKNKKKAKSKELKLTTVYDGWDEDSSALVNKKVYIGLEPSREFNKKSEAFIKSIYNTDEAELRVVNGDGASWIKNTYEPDRIFQLDRYHIIKEVKRCIKNSKIRRKVLNEFVSNNIDEMLRNIETYLNSIDDGTEKQEILNVRDLYKYLNNNYDGLLPWQAQVGKLPEAPEGIAYKNMGTQESQNCSLVCNRLKGRRMRWSESGANNISKIIYMNANGDLDYIIEQRDGQIIIPEEIEFKPIISASKVAKRIGSGNKWMELFNTSIPLLQGKAGPYTKLLRNIRDI